MMTRDEAFAKLGQGHQLDDECKRIIAEEWGFKKVVRCKDCQYAEYTHDTKGRPCYDTIYCERNDLQAIANWFCADGKKKDGESNG